MPDTLTIDRFQDDCAICEDAERNMHRIPREKIPPDAAEGDCLRREGDGWVIDRDTTDRRKTALRRRMDALWDD